MRVMLFNGSSHENGNTCIALSEVAKAIEQDGIVKPESCLRLPRDSLQQTLSDKIEFR